MVRVALCSASPVTPPAASRTSGCERDQFRGTAAIEFGIARTPAKVDPHVAAVGPAQLLQRLQERRYPGSSFQVVCWKGYEHADAPNAFGLRPRRERPRSRRAAKQSDEVASPCMSRKEHCEG
jgi:hypothetical protein